MKAHHLLLPLVLSMTLVACGKDKPAESSTAPADTATSVAPMEANQDASATTAVPAEVSADMDAHSLFAAKCASCHGGTGEGVGGNPKLTELTRADIESRLTDYRAGKQMGPKTAIMAAMAKSLSDEQIAALASYLGK
jgi:cytochrome c553